MVIFSFFVVMRFTHVCSYFDKDYFIFNKESGDNAIHIVSVVVVQVAIVVDITEVRSVRNIRRTLPPISGNDPQSRSEYNQCIFIDCKIFLCQTSVEQTVVLSRPQVGLPMLSLFYFHIAYLKINQTSVTPSPSNRS